MDKQVFTEIASQVLERGNIGLWIIEIEEGEEPRMYGDETMHALACAPMDASPERFYNLWYNNIHESYYDAVDEVVEEMINGAHAEVQYPWHDKNKGYVKIRCGGSRDLTQTKFVKLQGYHQDVTSESDEMLAKITEETNKKLELVQQVSSEQLSILMSLTNIYHSIHLIDIEDDTSKVYFASAKVTANTKNIASAAMQMRNVISHTVIDSYMEDALEFTNLSTIQTRMKGKKVLSKDFIGVNVGWFRGSFIMVEQNKDLTPRLVLFATQIIEDQKNFELNLLKISHTDGLTGILNRRAYEEKINELTKSESSKPYTILSMDVNGLKTVNDDLGHIAGDEIIIAAARLFSETFSYYGNVYRMGGDEFLGIIKLDPAKIPVVVRDFKEKVNNWHGKCVDKLSVSIGYVTGSNYPEISFIDLAKEADRIMYEEKTTYYIQNGLERRRN